MGYMVIYGVCSEPENVKILKRKDGKNDISMSREEAEEKAGKINGKSKFILNW